MHAYLASTHIGENEQSKQAARESLSFLIIVFVGVRILRKRPIVAMATNATEIDQFGMLHLTECVHMQQGVV